MKIVDVILLCIVASGIGFFLGRKLGSRKMFTDVVVPWRQVAEQRASRILDLTLELKECRNLVICPVCKGSGELASRSDNICQCCYGEGKITVTRYNAIQQVGRDIAKRIKERNG